MPFKKFTAAFSLTLPRLLNLVFVCATGALLTQPFSAKGQSEETYNGAFIWQGFAHQWLYNHQLSHFGGYVAQSNCNGTNCAGKTEQIADAGELADKCRVRTKTNIVKSKKMAFRTDSATFRLKGVRGETFRHEQVVALSASSIPYRQVYYLTLLNGFKIKSIGKPANAQLFEAYVTDGMLDAQKDSIYVGVRTEFQADCKSLCRCGLFNNKLEYEITIYFILLAGEDNYASRTASLKRQYYWDKKFELEHMPQRQVMTGDSSELYQFAFPAFKRLRFAFDKAYRYRKWNMLLENIEYDPATSVCSFDLDLFFQQWAPAPRFKSYRKTRRKSKKKAGLVIINTDICLVEIKEGCIEEKYAEGVVKWPGTKHLEEGQDPSYSSFYMTGGACR